MIGRFCELLRLSGGEWLITFTTREDPRSLIDRLKDAVITIDLKKFSPHRTPDANAFCWAICSDIGKALTPPVAKEEIYRRAIRAVGVYTECTVHIWDVDTVLTKWSKHGIGWFIDVVDDAGVGKKKLNLYYGSSSYTVEEMRILLDWLVDQAEQMEIPLPLSKAEEERVLKRWEKASSKQTDPVFSAAG